MKQYVRLLLAMFVLNMATAVSPTPALAQGGGATTSLSGTVTDTSGAIIPGANVAIKSNATATEYHRRDQRERLLYRAARSIPARIP